MKYYMGIDLGGTNIGCGVVTEDYHIIASSETKTNLPQTLEQIIHTITLTIHQALRQAKTDLASIASIGIGIPGIVNPDKGEIVFASNFQFKNVAMANLLEQKLGKKVYLENDANAAIYGEMLSGSGRKHKNIVMLTLGTGVGGGVIIDGKIYAGFNYLGAELGHVGIVKDGLLCPCGNRGCIEMYCSGTALLRIAKEYISQDASSLLWELCQKDAHKITGKIIAAALQQKDATAQKIMTSYTDNLAYAVTNYINIFQPEVLILGGGISNFEEWLLKPLRKHSEKYALGFDGNKTTQIAIAQLGNNAGIIGAAFLGQHNNA